MARHDKFLPYKIIFENFSFSIYPKWRRQSESCSWQGGPAPHMWRWFLFPKTAAAGGKTRWRGTLPGCGCPSPENTSAGSVAWSAPTNLRTAGLRQPGVQTGFCEGWLQEGCNWWLTGDRYRLLRSGKSRWGWARWGGILRWDRGEPTDQSVGLGGSAGKLWEQKVVLTVENGEGTK